MKRHQQSRHSGNQARDGSQDSGTVCHHDTRDFSLSFIMSFSFSNCSDTNAAFHFLSCEESAVACAMRTRFACEIRCLRRRTATLCARHTMRCVYTSPYPDVDFIRAGICAIKIAVVLKRSGVFVNAVWGLRVGDLPICTFKVTLPPMFP